MWSIDAVETHMRDQIRAAALAFDAIERSKKRRRLQSVGRRISTVVRGLRRDPITAVLSAVLVGAAVAVAWLLWTARPVGGGAGQSGLAISQGASLIFVVILTTLLFGPLEAGRSLGADAAWIARDARTWLGLALISGLSLTMLLLGWAKPDPREELATIIMTALGLATTALLVRRLLRLSDPLVQLELRRRQSVRRLGQALQDSKKRNEVALRRAGVSDDVVERVQGYADPETQAAFAGESRIYTAMSRSACGRSDWHLATGAYANAVAATREYLRHVAAVADADQVLTALVGEADDLHQMAEGPPGRPFAETLMQGLHIVGLELISLYGRTTPLSPDRAVPGLSIVARSIQTMATRELADMNATGPASAMRMLGDFAGRALAADGWATASYLGDNLIGWAYPSTNACQHHVAIPAWEEALKLLVLMFKRGQSHDHALMNGLCQDIAFAVEKVKPSVITLPLSGLDPIIKSSSPYGQMTLQLAWYDLWESECWALAMVADFGRLMAWQLTKILQGLDEGFSQTHYVSHELTETLYQFISAAATRADREADPEWRKLLIESMLNTLGWIRGWTIPEEDAPDKDFDLGEMLHCLFSAWQIVLFTDRAASTPRPALAEELRTFLSRMTADSTKALPRALEEGLALLEVWLRAVGYAELADEVRTTLDGYQGPDGFFDTQTGWGIMGSPYHTRRGGLIPAVATKVEDFFVGVASE